MTTWQRAGRKAQQRGLVIKTRCPPMSTDYTHPSPQKALRTWKKPNKTQSLSLKCSRAVHASTHTREKDGMDILKYILRYFQICSQKLFCYHLFWTLNVLIINPTNAKRLPRGKGFPQYHTDRGDRHSVWVGLRYFPLIRERIISLGDFPLSPEAS